MNRVVKGNNQNNNNFMMNFMKDNFLMIFLRYKKVKQNNIEDFQRYRSRWSKWDKLGTILMYKSKKMVMMILMTLNYKAILKFYKKDKGNWNQLKNNMKIQKRLN